MRGRGRSGARLIPIQPDSTVRANLPDFYPHPPIIWGSPVKLRAMDSRSETAPSPPEPTEDPLEMDPLGLVWGSEAAMVFMIPSLSRHLRVFWDYSNIDDCEQVALQISDWDHGFQDPNSEEALSDTGVRAWYKGPAFIDHQDCDPLDTIKPLSLFGDEEKSFTPHDINIHYTGSMLPTLGSDVYYLRLVPLDAEGNQIEPASDHVTVDCVDYPLIELAQCSVEHEWGESPLRRIYFSIRMVGEFPSLIPLCRDLYTPVSFVVWSGSEG